VIESLLNYPDAGSENLPLASAFFAPPIRQTNLS
jgi:hypothetical protein